MATFKAVSCVVYMGRPIIVTLSWRPFASQIKKRYVKSAAITITIYYP